MERTSWRSIVHVPEVGRRPFICWCCCCCCLIELLLSPRCRVVVDRREKIHPAASALSGLQIWSERLCDRRKLRTVSCEKLRDFQLIRYCRRPPVQHKKATATMLCLRKYCKPRGNVIHHRPDLYSRKQSDITSRKLLYFVNYVAAPSEKYIKRR